jgi:maltose phosphorylase
MYSLYMATKSKVAHGLLQYRYDHLERSHRKRAKARVYQWGGPACPMVTMNGERRAITKMGNNFREIHRNGAIAFAIFNYFRYTGNYSYISKWDWKY